MIELRSDTFTLPTRAMLTAMVNAELGNDGYHEDPTVIRLEKIAAEKLGKEDACFMPSGTMANLAVLLAYCWQQTSTVLIGNQADIYVFESKNGYPLFPNIVYSPVPTRSDGTISITDLEDAFAANARTSASPPIAVVCLENPHNLCGGVVLPRGYVQQIAEFVHSKGASLHLDGARIFNAAIATGSEPAELVRGSDSVQFCLSKGLAAPAGSMALGSSSFIEMIRRIRTILGGSMRQSGVLAAAGIVALENMVGRLAEDHSNARLLAHSLATMPGIEVDLSTVQTNTVVFRVTDPRFTCETFIDSASRKGLKLGNFQSGRLRAVVHHNIDAQCIQQAVQIISHLLRDGPAGRQSLEVSDTSRQNTQFRFDHA